MPLAKSIKLILYLNESYDQGLASKIWIFSLEVIQGEVLASKIYSSLLSADWIIFVQANILVTESIENLPTLDSVTVWGANTYFKKV